MGKKNKKEPTLEEVAGGAPNGSPVVGGEHEPEVDKAMRAAREAQAKEILHEQVRMERLHVSSIVLAGLIQSDLREGTAPDKLSDLAIEYADSLIKRVTEK